LVKYDKKGNIHFVGRVDNQIKLRGFKIELDEIEQNINSIDHVLLYSALIKDNNLYAFIQLKIIMQ
jgi:acyl-coenzyme A synthetase/AMP-(fatty) acid ligase